MKKIIVFLFFNSLIVISCFNKPKETVKIDYPESHFLDKNKEPLFKIIKLKDYTSFNELTKEIDRIVCTDSIPKIKFRINDTIKRIRLINFCQEGISCLLIRKRNIIEIHKDSVYKRNKAYPIDSLYYLMDKDFNNNKKHNEFADSPKKMMMIISCPDNNMKRLKKIINQITLNYEKIDMKEYLNVEFNVDFNGIQIPPLPPIITEKELLNIR